MMQKSVIAVLTAAIILLSAFAFLGNFSEQEKKSGEIRGFAVDQLLIKVLVKEGEGYSSSVRIANGESAGEFSVDAFGAAGMAGVKESRFFLNAGQTKAIVVEISSGKNEPGIYAGKLSVKSGEKSVDVPVIIEIETKDVLFDTNLNVLPKNRAVQPGADNTIEVRLFNLKDREMNSVMLGYSLMDLEGGTIITETESVVVSTQVSFYKTIHIPEDLNPGQYVFAARAQYAGSFGTSSYLFDVAPAAGKDAAAASLPVLYRNAAFAGAAILAILLLVLSLIYRENREARKEFETEIGARRREALSRKKDLEETKKRLEEEYRKRLAEELDRRREKKEGIAKRIRDANAAMAGQIKRMEAKTEKSALRKISGFMKEIGGAQKKMREEKADHAEKEKEKIAEKIRIENEKKMLRRQMEEEKERIKRQGEAEKKRLELQKAEEEKEKKREAERLALRREEERKIAAELRRKKLEALKRKIRHGAFKFLREAGIVKTKKEKLEEERRKKLEAEHELELAQQREDERKRIALENKRKEERERLEKEAEKREAQKRIKELEALEKRLELAEKTRREREKAEEGKIRGGISREKDAAKTREEEKKENAAAEHGRIISALKNRLKELEGEEARGKEREKKALENLADDYKKQTAALEEKAALLGAELGKTEEKIRAKYGSLRKRF
ncbi:MAG: hypothetical protein KKB25_02780, partial [Nanoarchaeota archaeon]|nr:hypothetical protein [Nanoarchaeota archaeon]